MPAKVFPIEGAVREWVADFTEPPDRLSTESYDWGAIGSSSKVAHYAQVVDGFQMDPKKPYAELWMGTHPTLPAKLSKTRESLGDYLKQNPELLGSKVVKKYGDGLPYLFKVLAIGKALSIQAHPDKALGKKLHAERPDVYKDPNHKPEMAIALTEFSGFCGFRPLEEIVSYLDNVPEFAAVVGNDAAKSFKDAVQASASAADLLKRNSQSVKDSPSSDTAKLQSALKQLFAALMNADADNQVKPQLQTLIKRYQTETGASKSNDLQKGRIEELVLRLNEEFPDDVGCFCSFLLNVVSMEPGQACFLQANEPHAYLSGHIMECMATSDNVVRAGLTPKLRDVPTLVDMLTYTWGPPSTQLMQPKPYPNNKSTGKTTLYDPPIDEFSVLLVDLTKSADASETLPAVDGPGILIITQLEDSKSAALKADSESLDLTKEGQTFFIGANTEISLSGNLIAYLAFVEVEESK